MEETKQPKPAPKQDGIGPRFLVSSSPHVHDGRTVGDVMRLVIYALLPVTLYSIYIFGLGALRVVLISIASAAAFEWAAQRIMKRTVRIGDMSAALTGLLLALN
ncbi:MAG: RnfABCDGE type electron transport complex subunit D, partial [Candidatus Krumholzibacteria bacterium]|nr:RnfABCDGE type electron transport complex subunit D [Candidatus Krumholzibacteria bacterium]